MGIFWSWRPKIKKVCAECGISYSIYKAWDRNAKFCSKVCQTKGRTKRIKVLIDCCCKECGQKFQIRKGRGGTGEYCSIPCMAVARGRRMRGANHPKWKGGVADRPYADRKLIADAIRAEGKCEECGSKKNLHGHHVNGYKKDKRVIQVLCVECHARRHRYLKGFILAPIRTNYGRKMDPKGNI